MRDQLEDALKHSDDGYGRAQHLNKVELPKRFYTEVGVAPVEGGFAVTLDKRQVRTPDRKIPIVVSSQSIATSMAEEWAAQAEFINPATMPMVRLINSAIESGADSMAAFRAEVGKFAANDLLLYRADAPEDLVADQEKHWDGALVRLARHFDVAFQPTIGIIHQAQPAPTLTKLDAALEGLDLLTLTALVSVTGITGSGLLAIGLLHDLFTPDEIWTIAHVDEDHQIRLWGEDEEASERRAMRRVEFDTAVAVVKALNAA